MKSSDLHSYGSNLRKRYTLRLLSMCLGRSPPCIRGKVSPLDSFIDFLRWAPFSLALRLCFSWDITKWCKIYTKTCSWYQKPNREFGQLQKFSDFRMLALKFTKFLMSFFKQKRSFYPKFSGSLFSVMRDNSSVLF